MKHPKWIAAAVSAVAIVTLNRPAAATSVIPTDTAHVRSLDGTWRFKLEQDGDHPEHGHTGGPITPIVLPKTFEPFEKPDYKEADGWRDLAVPANWEMSGISPATYNQPDNAIGLYRLEVDIPADWKGRIVKLNFDGVQNGAEVYLNGQPVNVDEASEGRANFHQGGHTAFQADLTPTVKFGEKNLLAVRVYKNTTAVDLDSGDYFFLGGIHRTVTLFSIPQTHIEDIKIETKVPASDKAQLCAILKVAAPQGAKVSMHMEGQSPVESTVNADGNAELTQSLDHVKLWSAEHPNLYTLDIDLKDSAGQSIEHSSQRIGLREVSIKDGILLINNVPVKFTGMCRHDCTAELGTALNEEAWRKDITLMKAANVNAIRTSHYPYGAKFYDLCDELGMYVMDEMAACWCDTTDEKLAPAFAQHARELVRRDKNHPSVVVWAVGNENREGEDNRVSVNEIGKLDTTRPRLVSWRKGEQYACELDDLHYTNPGQIAKLAAESDHRKKYPLTFLENPNDWEERNGADYGCLDRWAGVIDRTWQEVWKDDRVPGSFLWEWADRAVADKNTQHLYDYFPSSGINLVKVKGIVDAWRNPRADYYHVKMAYAPVTVDLKPAIQGASVTVQATNRYSFTDLSEVTTTWHLLSGNKELGSSAIHPALAPRSHGALKLDLPSDAMTQADVLRLNFADAAGVNIATYDLRLKPEADTTPKLDSANLADIHFPHVNIVPVTYGNNQIGWHWATRHPVKLSNITVNKSSAASTAPVSDDAALYAMPLSDVSAMDADLIQIDDSANVGHVHAEFAAGKFSYHVNWTKPNGAKNAATDIQELGWSFAMPEATDHFSWHRKAYWSYYPPTHIGRASGTALPDSANADVTKLARPDAFDFNSTKYDCNWASLLDTSSHGLAVKFDPKARHHVRAGTAGDGTRLLIVNKVCAPPRDISSGVVSDYYFNLAKGASVDDSFDVYSSGH